MKVERISKAVAEPVIKNKHYSRRLGIFWEGFGLYADGVLRGVCCYGQPSAPIQKHSFKNRDFRLYELTRLVVDAGVKNGASFLIANSLKMLTQKPCAVISYADSAHGHCGIVYQATNWLYTGAVVAHDSLYQVGNEILHPMTIRDRYGVTEPAKWAKDNGHQQVKPKEKHRYFYLIGSKAQKAAMLQCLAYPVESGYPKAEKSMYDAGPECAEFVERSLFA